MMEYPHVLSSTKDDDPVDNETQGHLQLGTALMLETSARRRSRQAISPEMTLPVLLVLDLQLQISLCHYYKCIQESWIDLVDFIEEQTISVYVRLSGAERALHK